MSRNGAATRQAIMDAAQALILESGFSATSVDAVIARAGLTKGAFFKHSTTRPDLAKVWCLATATTLAAIRQKLPPTPEPRRAAPRMQMLFGMGRFERQNRDKRE